MMEFLTQGAGAAGAALALNRIVVGVFFSFSGWHKLVVPSRHASLVENFKANHIPMARFNQWFVPCVELFAGMLLMLGAFAVPMALLLGAICLVAACTDGVKRVRDWKPLDVADCIDDVLYLPEVLLGVMLVTVILAGPGAFSIH